MTVQCRGAPTSAPADERDCVDADHDRVGDTIADETRIIPRYGVVRKCATAIHMSGNIKLSQRRALNLLLYMAAASSINETSDIEIALEVQRKDKGEVVGIRFAVARKVGIGESADVNMDAERLKVSGPADAVNDGDHRSSVNA